MKTYKNLFEKICSFENLHSAYLKARRCKRYRNEVLKFTYNLEENLLWLQEKLLKQAYQHGGYREFIVHDAKKRKIKAASFRDKVVHHALYSIIEPIFDKGFIFDSFACRKGKGTHKGIKRLETFLKSFSDSIVGAELNEKRIFCLQCDISKYFENIGHEILIKLLEKKICDKKTLWLARIIIESNNKEGGKGIPIGNLTSQLFANIYLNELDQFAKHKLRKKYYLRYMDDFLILYFDKKNLWQIKEQIREFLLNKLKLEFHPQKVNIFPSDKGIDFLGYRIFGTHRLLRKSTVKRFIKRTKIQQKKMEQELITEEKFSKSLQSWLVYAEYGDSWWLRKNLLEQLKIKCCLSPY